MHRAIIERGLTLLIHPAKCVLHPVRIVAVREVLARMSATAFLTVDGTFNGGDGLHNEIVELERLDEIRVPDERTVADANIRHGGEHICHTLLAGKQRL